MPYKRGKTHSVKLSEDHKNKLVKLAQSSKIDQKHIAEYLIDLAEKYNLLKPGWEDRLKESDGQRERYSQLDSACPAMCFMENYYQCLWGQDGRPPVIKKLSRDIDEAFDACSKCTVTLKIKLQNESYQARIRELEDQLKTKTSERMKIPVCQYGAVLGDLGQTFTQCKRTQGEVSIEKYCKVLNRGNPCSMYLERVIAVGEKIN